MSPRLTLVSTVIHAPPEESATESGHYHSPTQPRNLYRQNKIPAAVGLCPELSYAKEAQQVPLRLLQIQPQLGPYCSAPLPVYPGHPLAHRTYQLIGDRPCQGSQIIHPGMLPEYLHRAAHLNIRLVA